MVIDADERRIRLAFRALRVADERSAPSFARIRARAASRGPRNWEAGARLVLEAVAILAALGLMLALTVGPGGPSNDTAVTDSPPGSGAWASPTAFLLTPVDDHVLITVPVTSDSIVDGLLTGQVETTRGGVR
ncbi:MAG TPA: hypothetical protein VGR24_11390 [bacterium]|nr:hypothetical protein [bacterium]